MPSTVKLTDEQRAATDQAVASTSAAFHEVIKLEQVCRARSLSQAQLEKQADPYVSTLRRFVRAMGGDLIITAEFADTKTPIVIDLFSDMAASELPAESLFAGADLTNSCFKIEDAGFVRTRLATAALPVGAITGATSKHSAKITVGAVTVRSLEKAGVVVAKMRRRPL